MDPDTSRKLELASKATWVGDIDRAYETLQDLPSDMDIDPVLHHDIIFNLAIFSTLLNKNSAELHRSSVLKLYQDVAKHFPRTRQILGKKWKPRELRDIIKKRPEQMSIGEKLSFFISPKEALREFNTAIDYVRGLKLPQIEIEGKFRYSLDSDLSATIVRAYVDSELDLSRVRNETRIRMNYHEADLIGFSFPDDPSEIVARETGIVLVTRPTFAGEDIKERAKSLMSRLNRIFFPE